MKFSHFLAFKYPESIFLWRLYQKIWLTRTFYLVSDKLRRVTENKTFTRQKNQECSKKSFNLKVNLPVAPQCSDIGQRASTSSALARVGSRQLQLLADMSSCGTSPTTGWRNDCMSRNRDASCVRLSWRHSRCEWLAAFIDSAALRLDIHGTSLLNKQLLKYLKYHQEQ